MILQEIYANAPVSEVIGEARSAAEKALALDSRLGEAHVSLGMIAQTEWKWEEADGRFRRGIDLSPGYATGYHWYGVFLMSTGRLEEAISMMERARELDPLSLPVQTGLGLAHVYARRVDEAIGIYRKILELDPGYAGAHHNIAQAYLSQGRFEEALASMETVSRLEPDRQPPEIVEKVRAGMRRRVGRDSGGHARRDRPANRRPGPGCPRRYGSGLRSARTARRGVRPLEASDRGPSSPGLADRDGSLARAPAFRSPLPRDQAEFRIA